MSNLKDVVRELAGANRILAHEGIVDGFGHVSLRHPDDPGRFFLARARAPQNVVPEDILEFTLDGQCTKAGACQNSSDSGRDKSMASHTAC